MKLVDQAEVQARSPSAFGTFGMVLDGKLFGYSYLLKKDFPKRLAELRAG